VYDAFGSMGLCPVQWPVPIILTINYSARCVGGPSLPDTLNAWVMGPCAVAGRRDTPASLRIYPFAQLPSHAHETGALPL